MVAGADMYKIIRVYDVDCQNVDSQTDTGSWYKISGTAFHCRDIESRTPGCLKLFGIGNLLLVCSDLFRWIGNRSSSTPHIRYGRN